MNRFSLPSAVLAASVALGSSATFAQAGDVRLKNYNTPIPVDVLTPDTVRTRVGTFNYFDGFPDDETKRRARRQVDLGRGVQTFLNFMPAASLEMLYVGHRDGHGLKSNQDIGIFEDLMSSKSL